MTYDFPASVVTASCTLVTTGITDVHTVALAMTTLDGIVLTGVEGTHAIVQGTGAGAEG